MEHFYQTIDGWFWFEPAYRLLFDALPATRESVFVELGTYYGRSVAWLGVETLNSGKPVTIHAVDIFPSDNFTKWRDNLRPLEMLSQQNRLFGWQIRSDEAANLFADHSVDVVWVDADHSFEGCLADIHAWWPKLRSGGFMGGDDYLMEGVWRAVEERFTGQYQLIPGWCDDGVGKRPYPSWLVKK